MRIVFKLGTGVLTQGNELSKKRMKNIVKFLSKLHKEHEIIIVSSAAVASGAMLLKDLDRTQTANKQALAAVGQTLLIRKYRKNFEKYNIVVAQILLTKDDFVSFARSNNAKNAINTLLKNKIIPIINENDSVVVDELLRGDNDFLSAQVTHYFDASLLVILSDIDGYYDDDPHKNPQAKNIKHISKIDKKMLEKAPDPHHNFATGGIVTKLKAADFLLKNNGKMFLTSGFDLSFVKSFLKDGSFVKGTFFCKK